MKLLFAAACLALLVGCADVPDVDDAKPPRPYGAPLGPNLTAPTGHDPIVPVDEGSEGQQNGDGQQ